MKREMHTVLSDDTINQVSVIFKALADPTRIRILSMLTEEECSVNHLSEVLGISQSGVSHQLSFLRSIKLVKYRRSANTLYYSCDDDHVTSLLKQAIDHAVCGHGEGCEEDE